MGVIAVADNLFFPVVPDTGTAKAARLATEVTGNPGRWVRLDCGHLRHVQQPAEPGKLLECPTCPPSIGGCLPAHKVLHQELAVDAGDDVVRLRQA
jgi:hypothetical protein